MLIIEVSDISDTLPSQASEARAPQSRFPDGSFPLITCSIFAFGEWLAQRQRPQIWTSFWRCMNFAWAPRFAIANEGKP